MNVPMSAKIRKLIERKLADGRYRSAQSMVEHALTLLDAVDREHAATRERINAAIDRGMADARAGRFHEVTPEFVADVKSRGRDRLRSRKRRTA
ncbi:MAG: type II toxin-antitoxin system ParD family antitoxin [Phycisphaerales bacterium]|nr:type II toxin-antitoxin system ParD family antitoxin [Phycisphaerales bacterium]